MPIKTNFIGITQRLLEHKDYKELREALALEWGKFFKNTLSNLLPLPLSYEINFQAYANNLCGVILSGGNDLNSLSPNELSKKRDIYETTIIKYCIEKKLPLLGICRGAQMIAHYFDATIQKCSGHIGMHSIHLKNKTISTNSFHTYCITKLSGDLISLANASDNTIESFKHTQLPIYGIMWHIERENGLKESTIFQEWLKCIHKGKK